jgi:hypothetical protein
MDLQAAKRDAAARYEAIGMRYLPKGWTVKKYRKNLSGVCRVGKKEIEAPRPLTRKSLYIFLHECAHAILHADDFRKKHVQEFEAEKWAHDIMRKEGVPVPRVMTTRAKADVKRKIRQAGPRANIDPRVKAFVR